MDKEFSFGQQHGVMGSQDEKGVGLAGCIDDDTVALDIFLVVFV
jgi:hypothetical protein